MKFFLDFFPLVGFLATYYAYDIITATAVLIGLSVLQIGGYWLVTKSIEKMHLISFVLIVLFGGLTVVLKDAAFIKWKVSLINWLFFAIITVRLWVLKKCTLQLMFKEAVDNAAVPLSLWRSIDLTWAYYFLIIGFINVAIAFNLSEAIWVNFKVWGILISTFILLGFTIYRLSPFLAEEPGKSNDNDKS